MDRVRRSVLLLVAAALTVLLWLATHRWFHVARTSRALAGGITGWAFLLIYGSGSVLAARIGCARHAVRPVGAGDGPAEGGGK